MQRLTWYQFLTYVWRRPRSTSLWSSAMQVIFMTTYRGGGGKTLSEDVLRHLLRHISRWHGATKSLIICCTVAGVRVLRSKDIVHRDLKPANLLLHNDSAAQPPPPCFGLARYLADGDVANSNRGTLLYVAPEILMAASAGRDGAYTASMDLWVIGVILYECLTRNHPLSVSLCSVNVGRSEVQPGSIFGNDPTEAI